MSLLDKLSLGEWRRSIGRERESLRRISLVLEYEGIANHDGKGSRQSGLLQESFLEIELLALEAAKEVRLLGTDLPIMADPRYVDALSAAKERGAKVMVLLPGYVSTERQKRIVGEYFGADFQPEWNFQGWRNYNCGWGMQVFWDNRRLSPVERNAWFRELSIEIPPPSRTDFGRIYAFDELHRMVVEGKE